jgi:hypothetical protein
VNKQEFLQQILTRREAEQLAGLTTMAFQHHLKQGNIKPAKEAGKGTGKIQLFWKDDVLKIK